MQQYKTADPNAHRFVYEPVRPQPMPWLHILGYGLAGFLIIGLTVYISLNVYDRYIAPEPTLTPIQVRQQAEHVNYDVLLQHTERFAGKLIKYTGRVDQIRIQDGETLLVLYVSDKPTNLPDMLLGNFPYVLVRYDGTKTIRQGETLHVYGNVEGRKEFPSPAGMKFEWPLLDAVLVE
jgi:hypothetical protein